MIVPALRLARRGFYVFPLQRRAKAPITSHGCLDATLDEDQIRAWWSEYPGANIGINAGASGLLVIDLDGPNGLESWTRLECEHGATPTRTARTGAGRHLYYASAVGRNTAGKLGTGIDTRGHNGYVVAPPSIHPDGHAYEWENEHAAAPLPSWVLPELEAQAPTLTPKTYAPRDISGDPLSGIDPPAYVWLLTGQQVNRAGKTPCPLPGHNDWPGDGGSFQAYPRAEQGWFCFGCDRGGDIYTLAQHLWGNEPFPNLRRRLVDAVMGTNA